MGSYDAKKQNKQNHTKSLSPFIHLYMSQMLTVVTADQLEIRLMSSLSAILGPLTVGIRSLLSEFQTAFSKTSWTHFLLSLPSGHIRLHLKPSVERFPHRI